MIVALSGYAAAQRRGGLFIASAGDQATQQPLAGVEVVLPDLRRHGRTDSTGFLFMQDIPSGTHRVRARMLGYSAIDAGLKFEGDTTEVVFMLMRRVQSLDPVAVSEKRIDALPYFADRVNQRFRMGIGRFLNEAQLTRDENRDIGDVLITRFPGLKLSGMMGGRPCPVEVRLDDVPLPDNDLTFVKTWDLAGIEFYKGPSVPAEYRTARTVCGLVLLWSKR